MTTTTQQLPPTPAQRLAAKIRARTNDTRDILDLLHDIAQGAHNATEHDRLTATRILFDRGYGKCPKSAPEIDPTPETDHNDVEPAPYSIRGAIRESPPAVPPSEPESPRLVTQLDDVLHDSLGPAPSAETPGTRSPLSTNHSSLSTIDSSIHSTIRDHVVTITNDGDTLIDVLVDIAWPDDPSACPEPRRRVKPFHRNRASQMLMDRAAGTSCAPILAAIIHDMHDTPDSIYDSTEEEFVPDPKWIETLHEIKRMEDEGEIDVVEYDPFNPKIRITGTEEEVRPYADEVAAKFRAELDLQAERRAKWPEIEEYRRKKLAQIYPSHSQDQPDKPPDT